MPSNDNEAMPNADVTMPGEPDAYGHAALVLVESLMHVMIERDVLTVADGIEALDTALEVQTEVAVAVEAEGKGERMWQSRTILASIATSLRSDYNDPSPAMG